MLRQYASVNGLDDLPMEKLIKTQDVEYAVLKQLEWSAVTNNFDEVEKIVGVIITQEAFTEFNNMLTLTKKMRRVEIKRRFKREL